MDQDFVEYLVGGKRFTEIKRSSPNLSTEDSVLYRFDKLIFGGFILLVLAIFVFMFLFYGSDRDYHIYYVCDADARDGLRCEQPFYLNYPLCEQAWSTACSDKYVPTGFSFGEPAPWIVKNWGVIIGSLLAGAFFVNHFVHNRNFKFNKINLDGD